MAIPTLVDSFTADLNHIVLTEQSAELVFQLTDTVTSDVILLEKYTPDASGNITLYDIGKTLEQYLTANAITSGVLIPHKLTKKTFTFDFGGATQQIAVAFSSAEIGYSYANFKDNFYLSTLTTPKKTRIDSVEELYYYDIGVRSPAIVTVQQDNITHEITQHVVYIGSSTHIGGGLYYKNVSPSLLVVSGKTLLKYQVQVVSRIRTYVLDYNSYFNVQHFVFTNNFGVPETCYFVGQHTEEAENTRTFANLANGIYSSVAVNPLTEHTLNTGVLNAYEAQWLLDFMYSLEIYEYTGTTCGNLITLLEDTIKRDSLPTELPRFAFKYRIAQTNKRIVKLHVPVGIFAPPFDIPFD